MLQVQVEFRLVTHPNMAATLGPHRVADRDVCCELVQQVSVWCCADSVSSILCPPGYLTCRLAVGLCHPSCQSSDLENQRNHCSCACSYRVANGSFIFLLCFSPVLKPLYPVQIHQKSEFCQGCSLGLVSEKESRR